MIEQDWTRELQQLEKQIYIKHEISSLNLKCQSERIYSLPHTYRVRESANSRW